MKTSYMLLYKGLGRNRLLVTAPRTSYKKGRKKMIDSDKEKSLAKTEIKKMDSKIM